MEAYTDLTAVMEAMMNDPEAAAAATEMMALQAEYLHMFNTFLLYFLIASLFLGVLVIAATWRIFKKAGTGGWKALIPVYCDYSLIKISWKKKYFWIMAALGVISMALGTAAKFFPEHFAYISAAEFAILIAWIVIAIKAELKLARAFGKGGGFAVGMIFLPFIFYPILGFGKAKFRRRKRRRKKVQTAPEQE